MSEGKQHVSIVVCGHVDSGKCFQHGTPIMLSDGKTKLVETLTTQDCVLGLDGKPRKIVEVHHGNGQLYRVSQNNGEDYVVNGQHILVLKFTNVEGIFWDDSRNGYKARYVQDLKIHDKRFTCKDKVILTDEDKQKEFDNATKFLSNIKNEPGYNRGGDIIEISINDYLKLPMNVKRILYGFKQRVEFETKHVDLDPYMLGLWLGDGTTLEASITNVDNEIVDYIHNYASENDLRVTQKAECRYYIAGTETGKGKNSFLNQLNQYNLIGNKHIPLDYLFNDREIRLRVLAGLLDSDGYLHNNMYEIFQLSDKLAEDIAKLSRSLGFKTNIFKKNKTCVKKDGPNVTKEYNCVLISGTNVCDIPCLLDRKKAQPCGKDVDFLITEISVEEDEVGDFTGFQIEGDGRFFGTDYTILHNSTTTGHLIFELGGIQEREMQKLREEADRLGKSSFAFAFYMDRQKEERERGVTIQATTKEFFTETKHYTIIDAPGHRSFIKNMITGASQADVALIMVPADGNFTTAIAKGNAKTGEVQGQTRQHSLLINLLGVKQIIVGINKMDSDTAGYKESRYKEVKDEMAATLIRVGWPKAFVESSVPFLPISGWIGDNLIKKSEKMPWFTGCEVVLPNKNKLTVHTLKDALESMVIIPERPATSAMRTPISGIYKIKGIGDVLTGRVEQGTVKPSDEVVFLPTHTSTMPCQGKIFSIEMHHKNVESATAGDNCGFNIKGLVKENMPRVGDIMILKKDDTIGRAYSFTAQVRVLEHPGELKPGYCPIAFVRTGKCAVKMTAINWKMGKETGNTKVENPPSLKANEMGEAVFEPMQPFVVDTFKNCEGLGRVAILEGPQCVMLGKVTTVDYKERPKEEPKSTSNKPGDKGVKPTAGKQPTAGAKPTPNKAGGKK